MRVPPRIPSTAIALLFASLLSFGVTASAGPLSAGGDHTGEDHSGEDHSGSNLPGILLEDANLQGTDLSSSNLSAASFKKANLTNADLSGSNLTEASFEKATADGVDLTSSNLAGANLKKASLAGSDLRGADLIDAELKKADLTDALYDDSTIWPDAFDPSGTGAQYDSGCSTSGSEPMGPPAIPPVPAASDFGRLALVVLLVAAAALGLRQGA